MTLKLVVEEVVCAVERVLDNLAYQNELGITLIRREIPPARTTGCLLTVQDARPEVGLAKWLEIREYEVGGMELRGICARADLS